MIERRRKFNDPKPKIKKRKLEEIKRKEEIEAEKRIQVMLEREAAERKQMKRERVHAARMSRIIKEDLESIKQRSASQNCYSEANANRSNQDLSQPQLKTVKEYEESKRIAAEKFRKYWG